MGKAYPHLHTFYPSPSFYPRAAGIGTEYFLIFFGGSNRVCHDRIVLRIDGAKDGVRDIGQTDTRLSWRTSYPTKMAPLARALYV